MQDYHKIIWSSPQQKLSLNPAFLRYHFGVSTELRFKAESVEEFYFSPGFPTPVQARERATRFGFNIPGTRSQDAKLKKWPAPPDSCVAFQEMLSKYYSSQMQIVSLRAKTYAWLRYRYHMNSSPCVSSCFTIVVGVRPLELYYSCIVATL